MGVGQILLAVAAVLFGALLAVFVWRPIRSAWREARFTEICRHFHYQRERLEAKFVQLGILHAKSNAPAWADCEFDDDVTYARNRSTGELSAFVAVTIAMEEQIGQSNGPSDAVGNLHAATAVFRFDRDHWETDGRAIFNLSPTEAISFCRNELEMVGQEVAQHS